MTLGLSVIVLVLLPYVCPGLWAIFPAVVLWCGVARLPALVAGLAGAAAVLVLPPVLADRAQAADLAARGAVVASSVALPAAPGLEIRRLADHDHDVLIHDGTPVERSTCAAPCDGLSERLLAGGSLAWVRVVIVDDPVRGPGGRLVAPLRKGSHAMLRRGSPEACRDANPDPGDSPCILFVPDTGARPDLILTITEEQVLGQDARKMLCRPTRYRTVRIDTGPDADGAGGAEVFRAVQGFHHRPDGSIEFGMGAPGTGSIHEGIGLGRSAAASPPVDLVGAFGAIGLTLAPPRQPPAAEPEAERSPFGPPPPLPGAQDTALVASLLAIGPSEGAVFSDHFGAMIRSWEDRLFRKPALTDAERATYCASRRSIWTPILFENRNFVARHGLD